AEGIRVDQQRRFPRPGARVRGARHGYAVLGGQGSVGDGTAASVDGDARERVLEVDGQRRLRARPQWEARCAHTALYAVRANAWRCAALLPAVRGEGAGASICGCLIDAFGAR